MSNLAQYRDFLKRKCKLSADHGFEVAPEEIHDWAKPHVKLCVAWAVRGGRRALFANFGLHKTVMQLETLRLVLRKVENEIPNPRALIIAPLGVRQEFKRDADRLGIELRFVRRTEDVLRGPLTAEDAEDAEKSNENANHHHVARIGDQLPALRGAAEIGQAALVRNAGTGDKVQGARPLIYLTNYESIREGKLSPALFAAVSLDEAAVLRSFGSKTFSQCLFDSGLADVPFRFVATATPDPNDHAELLAYAAFLGIMDIGEARTRFFKRNSEKAKELTLQPDKEQEFWLWVASWALFLQKPSDLGCDDTGYDLPPMEVIHHEVAVDHSSVKPDKHGRGRLFREATGGVTDAAREKRETMDLRIARMREIVAAAPGEHFLLWHDLEAEREAIEDALPRSRYENWLEYADGNQHALALYERHYSARHYADGRERKLFCGPGEKTVLLTEDFKALFAWRKFIDDSGQQGVNCAVFRNESPLLSSDLIKEAMAIAWFRWPGERLYTYVDPGKVESENPGYCFLCAGWAKCGETKDGLLIFEALSSVEVPNVERHAVVKAVYGSQAIEEREQAIIDFSEGRIQHLAAKAVMFGAGCNFQRHCHSAVFVGIGFKFNDWIQAIHRIYRFLQTRKVTIHLIYAESERNVLRVLLEKWERHTEKMRVMAGIIRTYGLSRAAMASALTRTLGCERVEVEIGGAQLVNNDAVEEMPHVADNSVHLVLTSIPFSTQYEYTPSYNDFGHTESNEHFFAQMDFLTPELLRALQPGRVAAVHVKDRVVPGAMSGLGFQTVYPFHSDVIAHYTRHGFAFLGMKTIVTDVVRENNQTYRLGWTEQCKDGSRMGAGMPEYLLLFRKPPTDRSNGYADAPVIKSKEQYSRARWQIDAHGFTRSNGDRLLAPEDFDGLRWNQIYKLYRRHSLATVYDYEHHVAVAARLDGRGELPVDFMLLPPQSWHPDVWSDITRMRTLNSAQAAKGRAKHICPLQFDIVDRTIAQFTMEGETVLDPFAGVLTVPYRAVLLRRKAYAIELSRPYFLDGCAYVRAAERKRSMPSLFDVVQMEAETETEDVASD